MITTNGVDARNANENRSCVKRFNLVDRSCENADTQAHDTHIQRSHTSARNCNFIITVPQSTLWSVRPLQPIQLIILKDWNLQCISA